MNYHSESDRRRPILVLMLAMVLALTACAEIRLISDYDEQTEKQVTKMQHEVELFLTTVERSSELSECASANFNDFYIQANVDVNMLISRNSVRPKNEITSDQLKLLKENLGLLEEAHKNADQESRCMQGFEIEIHRRTFATHFESILRLELAKRRGIAQNGGN